MQTMQIVKDCLPTCKRQKVIVHHAVNWFCDMRREVLIAQTLAIRIYVDKFHQFSHE